MMVPGAMVPRPAMPRKDASRAYLLKLDDGVACTTDSCDEENNVTVHTPVNSACDDGAWCDGAETCDAEEGCQPGIPPVLDDGVACTDDSCDEATDTIVNTPNNANCDNGLWCDGTETCDATEDCQPGTPQDEDDGVDCTDDSCDEATDTIVNTPNNANCDDDDPCTTDICNPATGDPATGCRYDPVADCKPCSTDAECDTGNVCLDEYCNAVSVTPMY